MEVEKCFDRFHEDTVTLVPFFVHFSWMRSIRKMFNTKKCEEKSGNSDKTIEFLKNMLYTNEKNEK